MAVSCPGSPEHDDGFPGDGFPGDDELEMLAQEEGMLMHSDMHYVPQPVPPGADPRGL